MAKVTKPKSPGKRKPKRSAKSGVDPRQMGLFDARELAPATPQRKPAPKALRVKTAPPGIVERPVVLNTREAAQYLGVSVSTLKNWRVKRVGPKWTMRGARLVAYRPADIEKFLDNNSAKR
jgi:predicted DNA-binding transcriptional regulator AlpA